jgi:serine/threonine protein kinase
MPLDSLQNGRYQAIKELGSGSMGEVYLVNDTLIGRQVAIKLMRADPASYPDTESIKDAVRLFKREAQAIAQLEHPNILPLFDFGEEKRDAHVFTYMVMPNCQEGSLSDWLARHRPGKPLTLEEVVYFIEQAAEALQYAHDHRIIHQDVKPSNFLVRTHTSEQLLPDLLLADFGIARTGSGAAITTITTVSAGPRGTPRYMPPEQWEGKPAPASDQYALAVMAYQLLTFRYPFMGEQMLQLMYQHLQYAPEPPSKWNPALPGSVDAVILRALAKKPGERFPTVKEFARALRQTLPAGTLRRTQENAPSPARASTEAPTLPGEATYNTSTPTLPAEGTYPQIAPAREYNHPVQPAQAPLVLPAQSAFPSPAVGHQASQPTRPASPFQQTTTPGTSAPAWKAPGPQERPVSASRGKVVVFTSLILLLILAGAAGASYAFLFKPGQQKNPGSPSPTATTDPKINPYTSAMSSLRFTDPLSQPSMWQSLPYDQLTDGFCLFQQGAYSAAANKTHVYTLCPVASQQPVTSDMTFEVQMQILHGDCGGVLFRGDYQQGDFYYFDVCYDGLHYLAVYKQFALLRPIQLQTTKLPALVTDSHSTVKIGIVAQGSSLTFYLNGQRVDQATDATYSQGQIALFCFAINNPTEVIFSKARLWTT